MPSAPDERAAAGPFRPVRRRALRHRIAAGHVIMLIAGLLAFLLAYAALRDRSSPLDVVIAAADIPAGAEVRADLITTVRLRIARGTPPGSLLTLDDASAALRDGARFGTAVPQGSVLRWSDVAVPGPPRRRTMALPVDRAHAVDGDLIAGDLIDVLHVGDGVASAVLSAIPLVAVTERAFAGGGGLVLTVEVSAAQSLQLARAMHAGRLEIVKATGAEAFSTGLPTSPDGEPADG